MWKTKHPDAHPKTTIPPNKAKHRTRIPVPHLPEEDGKRKGRRSAADRERALMLSGLPTKTADNLLRARKPASDSPVTFRDYLKWTKLADDRQIERLRDEGLLDEIEKAFGSDDPKDTTQSIRL